MPNLNETLLEERLELLEGRRTWSPRAISRLETKIRTADEFDLFRINPLEYAAEKGLSETEAIDLFLHATKVGLFEMEWTLICPSCAHVVERFSQLDHLHTHSYCAACFVETDVALDDYIQVSFTVTPAVREIRFHHPMQLSAEEFYLLVGNSKVRNADGSDRTALYRSFSHYYGWLEGGECQTVDVDAQPGILQVLDVTSTPQVAYMVYDPAIAELQPIQVELVDGKWRSVNLPVGSVEVPGGDFVHRAPQMGRIPAGHVTLEMCNLSTVRVPVGVRNVVGMGDHPIQLVPFVTGKRMLNTQTFRDLFRTETVQTEEGIGVRDITFLFTDLKGSTALYDEVGDAKAFYLVRQHFDTLGSAIVRNQGAIVKTIGDAVMATFNTPEDALKAALDMLNDLRAFNRTISQELILKVGIHRGHSIVVTLNDRLDYFGQTVNVAARIQGLADANEIYLSKEAQEAPGVAALLAGCDVTPVQTDVKGVRNRLTVYRVQA